MVNGGERRRLSVLLRAVLFTILMTAGPPAVFSLTVTVSGGYGFVIDQTDLTGGAGSGFVSTHESTDDALLIDVGDTAGDADTWQIQVHREDSAWNSGLGLSCIRTGTGSGTGSINGGDVLPVELTAGDQVFFEGAGSRTDIPIKLILKGVSVLIPVDTYSTVVYITVVGIP